jgi:hypothetical protein
VIWRCALSRRPSLGFLPATKAAMRVREIASIVSRVLDILVWVVAIPALVMLGVYLRRKYLP